MATDQVALPTASAPDVRLELALVTSMHGSDLAYFWSEYVNRTLTRASHFDRSLDPSRVEAPSG